jgi:hypothetical protein
MNSPDQKLAVIRLSIQSFTFGIFGLIPFVGWFFRVPGFIRYNKALKLQGEEWNPAGRYLKAGRILSLLGIGLDAWIILVILIVNFGHLFQ